MSNKLVLITALLMLPLFITDCAKNPVTGKKQVTFMSPAKEQALGDQSDPQIVAAYGLYEDAEMQAFINKKGQQMGLVSHRPELKYTFKILDSPVVNAFALPGGYVYFTRGIMAHFNNEAEFAGVLGHEIGHITARHSAQQYTKQVLGQIGLMAGLVVSPTFRQFAEQANQGLSLMFLKFGRDDESESDQLGVEYSTKIGYDAHEMADFFQTLGRLQAQAGASIPDFLSSHPNPTDRFSKVHSAADEWQTNYPQAKKVNSEAYLRLIDGMIYGEDPKQGFVENNKFYHPELKFEFPVPQNWTLQNSPAMVNISPADGKALIQFSVSGEASRKAAADKLIADAGLQVVERADGAMVNSMPTTVMLTDQTPTNEAGQATGDPIRILSYFIDYGQYIYVFHGMAAQADFNSYSSTFKQTMTKFNKLTDTNMLNKKPKTIKIVKVQQGGALNNVLQSFGAKQEDYETIAILNGVEANANIATGTRIKIIVDPNNS